MSNLSGLISPMKAGWEKPFAFLKMSTDFGFSSSAGESGAAMWI